MTEHPLNKYHRKRDFEKTGEPPGSTRPPSPNPMFVVQKHLARNLHYDFRLEIGGVLKSWAVPKGPSLDPSQKRLAVQTEDHPLEYLDFEGTIPEDEYGAGTVIVWDQGVYRSLKDETDRNISMEDALQQGHITVWLEGKKLKGGYALIRPRKSEQNKWLFIKMDDRYADAQEDILTNSPESVVSGKTIHQMEEGKG